MRPSRVLQSTLLAMLFVQAVGSTDSKHKLPAPRQFVAVIVLWGILFLTAGTQFARTAARLSVLVLLTGMVLGPFGDTAVNFLRNIANHYTSTAPGGTGGGDWGGGTFGSNPTPSAQPGTTIS